MMLSQTEAPNSAIGLVVVAFDFCPGAKTSIGKLALVSWKELVFFDPEVAVKTAL